MRHLNRKLIASIQSRYYIKPNPKGRNDRSLEKDAKKCYSNWNATVCIDRSSTSAYSTRVLMQDVPAKTR